MKKKLGLLLIALMICSFSANSVFAEGFLNFGKTKKTVETPVEEDSEIPPPPPKPWVKAKDMKKMKEVFEIRKAKFQERLNLTEEQIKLHDKSRAEAKKKMKPIFDEIKTKVDEIHKLRNSKLEQTEKRKQICAIKSEIRALKQKADIIRDDNMKAFEATLNKKQAKELEKMKKEFKKKMEKKHKKYKNHKGFGDRGPACPVPVPCDPSGSSSEGACPLSK